MFVALRPAAFLAEQHRQRLAEVARRQPAQIQQRQNLGHLRRPPHIRRQDPAREPLPRAVFVNPLVVHTRRADLHRPRTAGHRAGLRTAVAHNQPPAVCVARVGMGLDVVRNLFLQRGRQQYVARPLGPPHPASERPPRSSRRCLRALGRVPSALGGVSFPPARQPGWYLCSRGRIRDLLHAPRIHNFRLYLCSRISRSSSGTGSGPCSSTRSTVRWPARSSASSPSWWCSSSRAERCDMAAGVEWSGPSGIMTAWRGALVTITAAGLPTLKVGEFTQMLVSGGGNAPARGRRPARSRRRRWRRVAVMGGV